MQAVNCVRPKVVYLTTKTIQTTPYTNFSSQVKRTEREQLNSPFFAILRD